MNRYEFLKSMGFKGAALMAVMTSCVREEDIYVEALTVDASAVPTAATAQTSRPTKGPKGQPGGTTSTVDNSKVTGTSVLMTTTDLNTIKSPLLKIDLTSATNAKLTTMGGYIIQSNIVVAHVSQDSYAAVTVTCTHEPEKKITLQNREWYCTEHGARFDMTGKGLNEFGATPIKIYKVATDGKTVVVY